jgi:hypothetical protein
VRTLPGMISDATFCELLVSVTLHSGERASYKVSQVDVSVGIEQNIVGFHITMNDALSVNVLQSTA